MASLRDVIVRLLGSARRRTVEAEMEEELQFHLDMETAKNVRLGMAPDAARRAAAVSFGGRERHKEDARDEARSRRLEGLAQDLRYAARLLRRSPGFAAVAVLSLALGIGANTAVFSVVNAVLLRPLPYPDPERLVAIEDRRDAADEGDPLSAADVFALREQGGALERFGAYFRNPAGIALTSAGEPRQIQGTRVTAGLLPALGVRPLLGRTPLPAEEQPGADRVVVLSHAFWRDHFAAAPSALGGTLLLDGEPHTVVGVMPPGFTLPGLPDDDVWPVGQLERPQYRAPFFIRAVARLAPGASAEQARAQLGALARRVKAQYPDSPPEWSYQVTDLKTLLVRDIRPTVLILYGAVALILLMSVGNVANLMLARATARARELAVRTALGAGRARLAAQLVTESTLVALLGGVLGLALAHAGVRLLVAAAPGELPRLHEVGVDGVVLLFTAAIALAAGLLVGVAPALALRHGALADELRGGNKGGTDSRERRRVRSALVVAEFALAIMLVVGAGLTIHSLLRLQRVQPGARADHVLVARLSLPEARYPEPAQTEAFFDQLLARVAAAPGVSEVGIGMAVPPNRLVMTDPFTPEGKTFAAGESAPVAEELMVSPGYFRALGIPLARGRNFTDADREGAPPVAIVNETMARRFYPAGDAVGRWIQTGDPDPEAPKLTIVGVVPDVKYAGLDAEPAPTIYVPFKQHRWWRTMYVVVRGTGDPLRHLPAVRGAIAAVDPLVPLQEARTMDDLLFASVAEPRFRAGLLGGFGAIALLLASAGIFGVMSYTVNQRRRETGVRLALGASRGEVMRVVVGEGVRLAVAGVVVGLALALALARTLAAVLYEVSPLDPPTFAATAALLVAVGIAACAVPAYRASRTDPMIAMRGE